MWWGLKEFHLSMLHSSKLVRASFKSSVCVCTCMCERERDIWVTVSKDLCCHAAKCKLLITCIFVYIKNTWKCSTAGFYGLFLSLTFLWNIRRRASDFVTSGCSWRHRDLGLKSAVSPHSFRHIISLLNKAYTDAICAYVQICKPVFP